MVIGRVLVPPAATTPGSDTGEYAYNVTQIDEEAGTAHVWRVSIAAGFESWTVVRIQ